jgi:Secretion system C-terminal sorting domain/Carbohydrate esterase, sialic acid-specific acetylesterase/Viral BACON domain
MKKLFIYLSLLFISNLALGQNITLPFSDNTIFQRKGIGQGADLKIGIDFGSSGQSVDYQVFKYSIGSGTPIIVRDWNAPTTTYPTLPSIVDYPGIPGYKMVTMTLQDGLYKIRIKVGSVTSQDRIIGIGEIFYVAGQSNASGTKNIAPPAENSSLDPWISYLNLKDFSLTTINSTPSGFCNPNATYPATFPKGADQNDPQNYNNKPFPWFWRKLAENLITSGGAKWQVPIAIYQAAWGGTSIKQWADGSAGLQVCDLSQNFVSSTVQTYPYYNLYRYFNDNRFNGVRAVLWLQGETDKLLNTDLTTYKSRLTQLINNSRVHAKNGMGTNVDLGWVVARASRLNDNTITPINDIIKAQYDIVDCTNKIFRGPEMDMGIDRQLDQLHYSTNGMITAAQRWADVLTSFIDNSPPIPAFGGGANSISCPSCDNGSAFNIASVTYNNSGTVQVLFNASNLYRVKWCVKKIDGTILRSGTYPNDPVDITTNNPVIDVGGALPDGSYNIELKGITCNGTAIKGFTVGGSVGLSVSQNTWSPNSNSNSQNVTVSSNINWSASSDVGWLSVSPSSGSNNGTITLTTTANGLTSSRTGTITVSGNGVSSQTISVTQSGIISGSSCSTIGTVNCGNASEGYNHTINIPQTGNYKFKITYASGESNATGSISVDSDPLTQFSVGPSTGSWTPSVEVFVGTFQKPLTPGIYTVRIAGVNGISGSTFAHNKLCAVLAIGGSTLSVSQNTWSPNSNSNSQNVTVSSNINWSASSDVGWLSVSPSSGSNNGTITLTTTANGLTSSRTGTITVSGNGVSSQTISVTQSGIISGSSCSTIGTVNCGNASEGYNHTINIPQTGNYKFKITYASGESNATGSISVDSDPLTQFSVGPSTGSWTPSVEVFVGTFQKPLTPGIHTVRIAGVNGISGSTFVHNKLCAVCQNCRISAFEEVEKPILVYPNPTNGKVNVEFSLENAEDVWINLYNSQGRSMDLKNIEGKEGNNSIELDIKHYPAGTYFINLQSSQKREVKKIVKID